MNAVTARVPGSSTPTVREMEVLQHISDGFTTEEIGAALYLTENSVRTLTKNLFRRLGVRERAHAVNVGFQRGWLVLNFPLPEPITWLSIEPQLLRLIARGWTYSRIGTHLQVGDEEQVKHRTRSLFGELRARNRAHAVRKGYEHGMLAAPGGTAPQPSPVKPTRPGASGPRKRELQVLDLTSRGHSYERAAEILGISPSTASSHGRRLFKRIGARDGSHAVRLGFERGWLIPEPVEEFPADLVEKDALLLGYMSAGLTNVQIARRLGLTPSSVVRRASILYMKLGVEDRRHAVRRGFELKVLRPGGDRG
ncbi:LuxR C-terminal-related transcriptional regulator [Lentzea sp. BCCO 10_0798]|uniref:LuxR C-terminal-related transcriptional regulator n=1 Tax=Lentzea kristufekii TaxID=3095430 RepID=A0ABU4TR81_9PSEU|nr:LuxR C-terminal-related transcriptional regulator [Lentzea sp. BCCO 10_0798]MDX8050427.1 LuxR C-terminal-related transcriptional regulator [Lentzea sp. BCCO 10_0798]